jgi:hypothetical protein
MCGIICEKREVLPSDTCTFDELECITYHGDGKEQRDYPVQNLSRERGKNHVRQLLSLATSHNIPV